MKIIPVINCHFGDDECVLEKIKKAQEISDWVHLDVADGVFTFNKTWSNPSKWKNFNPNLNLEVHLMTENPEDQMENWILAGAKRIIFHWEAIRKHPSIHLERNPQNSILKILDLAKKYNVEMVMAVCVETPLEEIKPFLEKFNYFQILAVLPGPSGQKFLWPALDKIKELKQLKPNAIIEVDGGINPEVVKKIKSAGAEIAVSGSYIFHNPNKNFKEAFNEILQAVGD